ncbi:MAG: phage portal protein [Flavobacterium sp.]|nr:phage portal protein [Flavobacterium sp.]
MAGMFQGVFSKLFSRWIHDNPPFYPLYSNFMYNNTSPILIDVENLYTVYISSPHLRAVIDRKAEMFKNMEICMKDADGNKVEDHPLLTLLNQPNPLQNREQWLTQLSIQQDIWTCAFVYMLYGYRFDATSVPKALWNLPPDQIKINRTGKIWEQTTIDGIIKNYELLDGSNKKMLPNEVMLVTTQSGQNYIIGESKLLSLRTVISNIDSALKTRNCIINDRGALGILANNSKDQDGGLPLDEKERKRIEQEYRNSYGISDDQKKILITNSALTWQPMSFPTKDLLLFEEIEDDFAAICGMYGMSRDIFPSVKGATFENTKEAIKQTYQNTIQPQADQLMRIISNQFNLKEQGLTLEAEYDWLPVMKDDELKEAQAEQAEYQAIQTETQTIINLNTAVKQGNMSYESAINMLIISEEYSPEEAAMLITKPIEQSSSLPPQNTGA